MSSDPTYYRLSRAVHFGEDVFIRFTEDHGVERQLYLTAEDFGAMLVVLNRLTKATPLDILATQATPSEDNEIDAVVSALAALTDRVRALEARAEPKAASPFSFGDDGKLYVSPAVIPKVSTVEQCTADETAKPVPSASELYDEITRITTEPTANLLARLVELESAASTLQTSVDTIQDDVSSIRGTIEALERGLGEINAVFYGNEPAANNPRGRQS